MSANGGPGLTILHLSDLQFGPRHRFAGGSLVERIGEDLAAEQVEPDLVILTGDIAETGMPGEFEEAERFVVGLCERLALTPEQMVVVPGNHDVNRKKSEGYFKNCEGDGIAPVPPYWPKLEHFAAFFARVYASAPTVAFSEEQPWTLFELPELRVVVAGLNSTIAESHLPEHHYGFIGEPQMRWFAQRLRRYREQRWLRIGAVHHDLIHPEGGAAGEDAALFQRVVAPWLNLVLSGHIHREKFGWLDGGVSPVPVLGIGSTGVEAAARPEEVANQYQVVQVTESGVVYATRRWVPDQRRWVAETRADLAEGRDWLVQRKVNWLDAEGTFSAGAATMPANGRSELARLIEMYRSRMAEIHRRETFEHLAGLSEEGEISSGLDLPSVYVPPQMRRDAPPRDLPRSIKLAANLGFPVPEKRQPEPWIECAPESVEKLLAEAAPPWTLVLGAPGAGKTALTRWLILELTLPSAPLEGELSEMVPARIEMRRFDERYQAVTKAGGEYDFHRYLDEVLRERSIGLRGGPLRQLAKEGRLFWLFDGFDEVPVEDDRKRYAEMIAGLKAATGGRGVITSRIVGAGPVRAVFDAAGIVTQTLLEFEPAQAERFFDRWHVAAFRDQEVGRLRRERLRRAMTASSALRDLSRNPLLATLIALLNRSRELPQQRHQIYARAVEQMAHDWDANKQLGDRGAPGVRLDLSEKLRYLRRLGFWMMEKLPGGRGNRIGEEELLRFTASYVRELGEPADRAERRAAEIIAGLRKRDYVLALVGDRLFGFVHRTFLEYLAAVEICARYRDRVWDVEQIAAIFQREWYDAALSDASGWREVLTLVCAVLGEERPELVVRLLQGVLAGVQVFNEDAFSAFAAFSIRCLAELRDLEREPVRGFALRLMEIVQHGAPHFMAVADRHQRDWPNRLGQRLNEPLRLLGDRWPDRDGWRRWFGGMDLAANDWAGRGAAAWLAATTPAERRATMLCDLLVRAPQASVVSSALWEARWQGDWRDVEASTILEASLKRGEQFAGPVADDLARTGAATPAATVLQNIIDRSGDWRLRWNAAYSLAQINDYSERGWRRMVELMSAPDADLESVIFWATFAAHTDERWGDLIDIANRDANRRVRIMLASSFASSPTPPTFGTRWATFVDSLSPTEAWETIRFGPTSGKSSPVQESIVAKARALNDLQAKVWIAQYDVHHGGEESGISTLSSLGGASDEPIRREAARVLLTITGHAQQGRDILLDLARNAMQDGERSFAVAVLGASLFHDDAVRNLFLELSTSAIDERVRIQVASALASVLNAELAWPAVGRRVLVEMAFSAAESSLRVWAVWRIIHSAFRADEYHSTLTRIAESAPDEESRRIAAARLARRDTLRFLSESASSPEVRTAAARNLRTLELRDALLLAGRRRGVVSLAGQRVGVIEETDRGSRFLYDAAWLARTDATPISPTLPLRPEPFESHGLHPYFANLLPEGWLLQLTSQKLKIDKHDEFGLLLATCDDCIGAVEVHPERDRGMSIPCLICLEDAEGDPPYHAACLERLFGVITIPRVDIRLTDLPAAVDAMVGKISISGVQSKLSMRLSDDGTRLEVAPSGGRYILKPKVFDDLPANEHLSMLLAGHAGIDTPPFGLIPLADGSLAYIVRRFDRAGNEPARKLRQEDFCQLTGREPEHKYDHPAELCAEVIRKHVASPGASLRQLFLRMLFSYWIGNGDLHLKNLSLLDEGQGFELSPAYDIVSTWLYNDEKLALYVNGHQKDVRRRDWLLFAAACGIEEAEAQRTIDHLTAETAAASLVVDRSLLPPSLVANYRTVLRKRTVALEL